MTTIRKTAKGVIIENDGYSAYYNATISGTHCRKIWIARDLWDNVTAKWVDGDYTDCGETFHVGPEDLDSYLRVTDLMDHFTTCDGDFMPGVRILEDRVIL